MRAECSGARVVHAGVASLWGAIAADMGASLLVVFNALRLLRSPEEPPVAAVALPSKAA